MPITITIESPNEDTFKWVQSADNEWWECFVNGEPRSEYNARDLEAIQKRMAAYILYV